MKEIIDSLREAIKNNNKTAREEILAKLNQEELEELYFNSAITVDKELLEAVLPKIPNKNILSLDGWSVLHLTVFTMQTIIQIEKDKDEDEKKAIFLQYKEIIEILLKSGVPLDIKNANGQDILFFSLELRFIDFIKYLIEDKKFDINSKNKNNQTILDYAMMNGYLELVKYLVEERELDINAMYNKDKAVLHNAIISGNIELVKYLVEERGLNINDQDNYGSTALHHAAESGNIELVKYLVEERGLNINDQDNYGIKALHYAAWSGNIELVKYLVEEKELNINDQDNDGSTVLHFAARSGNLELVKYLIEERGLDVNDQDNDDRTVLHFAARSGNLELVKYLIEEKGLNVNAKDIYGYTVLHEAVRSDNLELVKYLVEEKKLKVNVRDILIRIVDRGPVIKEIKDYLNVLFKVQLLEFLIVYGIALGLGLGALHLIFAIALLLPFEASILLPLETSILALPIALLPFRYFPLEPLTKLEAIILGCVTGLLVNVPIVMGVVSVACLLGGAVGLIVNYMRNNDSIEATRLDPHPEPIQDIEAPDLPPVVGQNIEIGY